MSDDYRDATIECASTSLRIRMYYFPFGTKSVPYASIKGLRRVTMTALKGKGRIWGTGNVKYWANLDTRRPVKQVGFIVDNGKWMKPFVTPDDPDAFERSLRSRAGLGPPTEDSTGGPFI